MRGRFTAIILSMWSLGSLGQMCYGQDQRETQFSIDLTKSSDAKPRASWAKPFDITARGLGWTGDPTSSRDGWIQTRPIPLGASWCPAQHVRVVLGIQPLPAEVVLDNGQRFTPYAGNVFLRYSPDLKHWSSWQSLQPMGKLSKELKYEPGSYYSGFFAIPQRQAKSFSKYIQDYAALDVPWKSDREAVVRWILKKDPQFLAKNMPFMGYVQFLHESSFKGSRRISKITGSLSFDLHGSYIRPSDGTDFQKRDRAPWRFSQNPDALLVPTR